MSGLQIVPMSISDARTWVERTHRHLGAPLGGLFALGLARDDEIVGAAIVGRPIARLNNDGWTAEVTRVAVQEGVKNGCSKLYGAAWRAARALGYRRLLTYTRTDEPGTSLRAAGWTCIGKTKGDTWNRPNRPRIDQHPAQRKFRWEMAV